MEKSDDIKVSDLLERVRKNLRQQEGEPEPEVLTEEFILKHDRMLEDKKRISRERGELIKELFGSGTGDDDAALIEDYFEESHEAPPILDDDADLPAVLEDALSEISEEQTEETDRIAVDYNLISMFGMQDVEDEDESNTHNESKASVEDDLPVNFVDYDSPAQTRFFFQRFKKAYKAHKSKTVLLAILLVATFLIENVTLFTKEPVGFLSAEQFPYVYFLWGVQVLLLCFALTLKKIFKGIGKLFKGSPTVDSIYAIGFILSVVYTLSTFFGGFGNGVVLFNLPIVILALTCEFSDLLNVIRQMYSFGVLVDKKEKTVIEKQKDEEIEQEMAELDDFIDSNTNFLRIVKAEKIKGFFRRFESSAGGSSLITVSIPMIVLVSVVLALLSYMKNGSLQTSLQAAMLGLGLSVPVCLCIAYSLPTYRMTMKLYPTGTAVIGNKAISEYSSPAVMQMKDTDIFPSKLASVVAIKTFGDAALDTVLHYYAAVFAPLGGPLGGLFRTATSDYKVTNDVDYIRIDDDGIECAVEDRHIYVGKYSFVNRRGYSLYKQTAEDEDEGGGVYSIYMVLDDRVVAVVKVKYRVSKEVKKKLYNLRKAGIGVCVRTFDPNITTTMVMSMIRDPGLALRVIKCKKRSQRKNNLKESYSGIITSGDPSCLYKALACAEKCKIASRALQVMSIICIVIGAVVGYSIVTFSGVSLISAPVILYHLFWITLSLIITKLFG